MNIRTNRRSQVRGFGLIEVMIALVVLAIGILGISKLQGTLVKNSSDANQRTVAVSIAQKKIDDLKGFARLTSTDPWTVSTQTSNLTAASLAYAHIGDNTGGAAIGSSDLLAGAVNVGNYSYTLNWDVTDYWYLSALTGASTAAPSPAPSHSDQKLVTVTVAWTDESDQDQSVSLSTVLDSYAPQLTAFSDNPSNIGDSGPRSTYTPGVSPEVVKVGVGDIDGETGLSKESNTPDITVSQNSKFVEYSFSAATYNQNNELVKLEEAKQINCTCELQSTNAITYYPATVELEDDEEYFVNKFDKDSDEFKVPAGGKPWGAPLTSGQYAQQSENCDICCRDHHDKDGNTADEDPDKLFDPFRPRDATNYANGDHKHYNVDGSGNLVEAVNAGDTYLEACNLVRIDGIWRVAQDLNILTIKSLPESYLLGTGFTKYQTYKTDYLTQYAKNITANSAYPALTIAPVGASTVPSTQYSLNNSASASYVELDPGTGDPNLVNPELSVTDQVNLRSKTLYARYIPAGLFAKLKTVVAAFDGTDDWLDISNILPYYDPDGTNIAQTGEDTSAWGSVDPSKVSISQLGVLEALAPTGVSNVQASAARSNSTTAFTNTRPIDLHDADLAYVTFDDIDVKIGGSPPSPPAYIRLTISVANNAFTDPNSVSVVGSSGASCNLEAKKVKNVHLCTLQSGTGVITFGDYVFSTTSKGKNPVTTITDNKVCFGGNELSTVAVPGSEIETSTTTLSGETGTITTPNSVNVTVITQGSSC